MIGDVSFYTKLYVMTDHLVNGMWLGIGCIIVALVINNAPFTQDDEKTLGDKKVERLVNIMSTIVLVLCFIVILLDNYIAWKLVKSGMSYNELHNLIVNYENRCK